MCEPESHTRQTCEALENTLVRLNHVNSTPVSLQLAWLVVSFYIGTRDFMLQGPKLRLTGRQCDQNFKTGRQ